MSRSIIVKAVNQLQAEAPLDANKTVWRSYDNNQMFFHFGTVETNDTVCMIDEYNACIDEMSEAKWMRKPKENKQPAPIMSAIDYLKAEMPTSDETTVWCTYVDGIWHYSFGRIETGDTFCSVDKYAECIKELSEAKWMQAPTAPSKRTVIFQEYDNVTFSDWCDLHVQIMGNTIKSIKDRKGRNIAWYDIVTDDYFIIEL